MSMVDLSILIPARNEMFLARTIQDLLEHSKSNMEIIAVMDGTWSDPGVPQHEKVTVIHFPESVGQRAATNRAAEIARGKYVMKVDAHCAFDDGFDVVMLEDMQDDITMAPIMRNLHAFDWVCPDGHRRYQGPSGPCKECGKPTTMDVVWIAKRSPQSTSYRFDKTLHFQYHNERHRTAEYKFGLILGYVLTFDPTNIPLGIVELLTNLANSHHLAVFSNGSWFRENVSTNTMGFSTVDGGRSITPFEIELIGNETKMGGVTTASIVTRMIDDGDVPSPSSWNFIHEPSIKNTMCQCFFPVTVETTISRFINSSDPIPASGSSINSNVIDKFNKILGRGFLYSENSRCFHNGIITLEPIIDKKINTTLSLQGSFFMMTRQKYFDLNICDETWGSWGQQGVEVAVKTWLSGGRVLINKKTWYAHMFRTQGGDFGFPYPLSGAQVEHARKTSREVLQHDKWDKAVHPFSWLMKKFSPVPDWEPDKAIIYYTCNTHKEEIDNACRVQLSKVGLPIVSVSLNKSIDFGDERIVMEGERSPLTMHKQIVAGLTKCTADYVFLAESDVLYPPSHFDFTPKRDDVFYFNVNVWKVRYPDGLAVWTDNLQQLSGMCGSRELLLDFFSKRLEQIEREGFNRHYEPGAKQNVYPRMKGGKYGQENYMSSVPLVCIRHDQNLTKSKWTPEEFRDQRYAKGWKQSDIVPGWGKMDQRGIMELKDLEVT